MAEAKRRNLGRGLSALLGEDEGPEGTATAAGGVRTLPIEFLHPSPYQPRHRMNDEQLQELAQSIADKGVLQPLLVRRDPTRPDSYEIIAGERRWRASQLAQVHEVPVIVREMEDREVLEIALIENLQREDLSPLDEAEGYRRLKDEFAYTQAELATSLGKSRSHVANTMRLLNLPAKVKELVETGALTAGHARALLNAEDPAGLAAIVVKRGLNVRQAEKMVQAQSRPARPARSGGGRDPDTLALERDLSNLLGLKVGIRFHGGAGNLTIHYQSLEQLDEILHRLSRGAAGSRGALPNGAAGDGAIEPLPDDPMEALADFIPGEDGADPLGLAGLGLHLGDAPEGGENPDDDADDVLSLADLGLDDPPEGAERPEGPAADGEDGDDLPDFPGEDPDDKK